MPLFNIEQRFGGRSPYNAFHLPFFTLSHCKSRAVWMQEPRTKRSSMKKRRAEPPTKRNPSCELGFLSTEPPNSNSVRQVPSRNSAQSLDRTTSPVNPPVVVNGKLTTTGRGLPNESRPNQNRANCRCPICVEAKATKLRSQWALLGKFILPHQRCALLVVLQLRELHLGELPAPAVGSWEAEIMRRIRQFE